VYKEHPKLNENDLFSLISFHWFLSNQCYHDKSDDFKYIKLGFTSTIVIHPENQWARLLSLLVSFCTRQWKILWCMTIWAFDLILYKRMCPQEYKIMPWVNQHHFGTMIKISKSICFISEFQWWCFIGTSLCRMDILVINIATISELFHIIISHKSNCKSKSFLVVCLVSFQCFLLFVFFCFSYTLSMFFSFGLIFVSCCEFI
jgi:hypothetical protein